jgi:ArsR family transcriptional regulator
MQKDLDIFKACSDQTRLRILFLLSERELCVCELVSILNMPQGKISRHLAILKNADLVSDRRDGLWIYYSLIASDTGLKKRLTDYLQNERDHLELVIEDLNHLDKLACAGEICVPRPSIHISSHN